MLKNVYGAKYRAKLIFNFNPPDEGYRKQQFISMNITIKKVAAEFDIKKNKFLQIC